MININYYFILGFLIGFGILIPFDWLIINFVYLSNIDLFNDLILTKKNSKKLRLYYTFKNKYERYGKNE